MIFHSISKKPVLLIGNGVRSAEASQLIYDFINKTNIPVITSMNAVDLVQDKNNLGFFGVYGNRVANLILSECDLIIAVGVRLGLRQIGPHPIKFAPKAKLIRVDIDEFEIERSIKEDEEKYIIDAKTFLTQLLEEDIPKYNVWSEKCFRLKDLIGNIDDVEGNIVVKKISDLLPINPIVSVDVGQNQVWSAQSLNLKGNEGRIFIAGGYGSMGCGIPYAIGASISQKYSKVYCITGDGGLQMNIQEFETIVREKIPIKILVLNNKTLGKITEVQSNDGDKIFTATAPNGGYTVPNFVDIAKAYKIKAISLENYELLDKYKNWLADDEPCLIDIKMSEDTQLIPKVNFHSYEILPKLEVSILEKAIRILK